MGYERSAAWDDGFTAAPLPFAEDPLTAYCCAFDRDAARRALQRGLGAE